MTPEQRAIKNVGKQVCSFMLLTVKLLDECNSSNVKFWTVFYWFSILDMNVRTTLNSIKYYSKASLEQSHIMAWNEITVQELSFEWCYRRGFIYSDLKGLQCHMKVLLHLNNQMQVLNPLHWWSWDLMCPMAQCGLWWQHSFKLEPCWHTCSVGSNSGRKRYRRKWSDIDHRMM